MEDAKKTYNAAVAKMKSAEGEFQALAGKLDAMEAETAAMNAKVTTCEGEEKQVYDSYFLGKASEKDLSDAQRRVKNAKDAISAHSKMLESLGRCITTKDREIVGLRKQVDNLRHHVWQSFFEKKSAEISENVKATVKELVTIGLNCAMGRDFILPKIFVMPTNTEIQAIYKKVSTDLGIE